jgi:hypothetical protein
MKEMKGMKEGAKNNDICICTYRCRCEKGFYHNYFLSQSLNLKNIDMREGRLA